MDQFATFVAVAVTSLCFMEITGFQPKIHPVAQNARIKSRGDSPFFYDSQGRVRLFHGVNSVRKSFPWYEAYFLNDRRMDDLRDWGLNVVRLGVMWAGAEPEEGTYNATYMAILKDIVQRLADRGIYSLLDMHQDCATSKYQSYDGFPRWLVDKFPDPPNPFPWPQTSITFWEQKYFTQAVSQVFQHVYNNTANALDKWSAFWKYVAENFKDQPYVIGYNVINEPWVGDYFQDQSIFLPGNAGRRNLAPSYEQINQYIREADEETIFFYEPAMYGMIFDDLVWGSGFSQVPGGERYKNASAYSFHAYCWPLEFIDSNAPDSERQEAKEFCDNTFYPQIMEAQRSNINRMGGASMLTEYGLCNTYQTSINVRCEDMLNLCDDYLVSWTDWDYADYKWYRNNTPFMPKVRPYIRPYARAVAGTPTLMSFDPTTDVFLLEYDLDLNIHEATEIYVPRLRYEGDYNVEVTDNVRYVKDANRQLLLLIARRDRVVPPKVRVTLSTLSSAAYK